MSGSDEIKEGRQRVEFRTRTHSGSDSSVVTTTGQLLAPRVPLLTYRSRIALTWLAKWETARLKEDERRNEVGSVRRRVVAEEDQSIDLNSPRLSVGGTGRHEVCTTDMNGEDLREGRESRKVRGEGRGGNSTRLGLDSTHIRNRLPFRETDGFSKSVHSDRSKLRIPVSMLADGPPGPLICSRRNRPKRRGRETKQSALPRRRLLLFLSQPRSSRLTSRHRWGSSIDLPHLLPFIRRVVKEIETRHSSLLRARLHPTILLAKHILPRHVLPTRLDVLLGLVVGEFKIVGSKSVVGRGEEVGCDWEEKVTGSVVGLGEEGGRKRGEGCF